MEVDDGRKKKDPERVKMGKCEDDGQNTPYSGPAPAQPSLQQLQEELQSQQLTNEALQHENSKLKEQSAHDKNTIETYQRKLQEYHSAVNQRDQLLGQMKSRMSESLQQQEKHRKDYQQKGDGLTREVNVLKAQLKEMTDSIANNCSWLSGVNPSEYIQLKNKVIGIEENQRKDIEVMEKLTLRLKIMNQRNVELQAYQEMSDRLETDIMALKDTIERQKKELKEADKLFEDERKALKERNNLLEIQQQDLEETVKVLDVKLTEAETYVRENKEEMQLVRQREQEAKERTATEVQDLMQQLQAANKALSESQRQASLEAKLVEDTEKLLGEVVKEKEEGMDNLKKAERKYEEAECLASSLKTIVENLNEDLRKVTAERVDIESQLSEELKNGEQLIAEKLALEERIKDNMETYSSTVMKTKGEKEELNIKLKDFEYRHGQVLEELETKKKKLEEIEEARLCLADEKEKVEGETVKLLKENEFLTHELSQCTEIFTAEIEKFKEEAESKIHLEKEMLILKSENKDLMEKSEVLACYQEQCNTLKTTLNERNEQLEMLKARQTEYEQLQKQMEEKERETETLKENYVTLINQCSEAEAQRKQLKEEYEEKCHRLNEGYKRLDAMIADAVSISSQSSEVTDLNLNLEKNLKIVIGKLRQSEENMLPLEEGLQKLTLEKEHERNELVKEKEAVMNKLSQVTAEGSIISQQLEVVEKERERMLEENKKLLEERDRLVSEKMEIFKERKSLVGEQEEMQKELCDTRMIRDTIEEQKNMCEVEKDKLLEEYRRKEAQLAEALLALDRQAQLPNPPHFTSQSGISVSTSTCLDKAILQHSTESKHNVEQQPNIVKAVIMASANPSNDAVITITKKCDGVRETTAEAEIEIDTKNLIGQRINDTEKHLARLDKENKELKNELQKLTTKTHDQRFTIKSLENERSRLKRRVVDLESDKMALRADQERLIQEKTKKMELLNDLTVKMDKMEDKMKPLEKDSCRLHQALRGILQGEKSVQDPDVQEVVKSIKPSTLKRDSSGSCDFQKECQTSKSEEFHYLSEEFHSLSEELLQTKREVDQLHTEKLGVELENINLTAQLEKLKSGNYSTVDMNSGDFGKELVCEIIDSRLSNSGIGSTEICDEEIKLCSNEANERTSTDSPSSDNTREYSTSRKLQTKDDHGDSSTVTSTIKPKSEWSQEEDVRTIRMENKMLRNLEKLHLRSSKLRKSSVGDLDQELLTVGVRAALEQLVAEWESQQFTSLQEFIDVQAARVRVVAEQLGGHGPQVWDSMNYVKAAMRLLHQAVIKGVCGEYSSVVRKTVAALDQHITSTLQHITKPAVQLPYLPPEADVDALDSLSHTEPSHSMQYDTICFDTQTSDAKSSDGTNSTTPDTGTSDTLAACVSYKDIQYLTHHVTQLIDVRTTLVEAATEFEEELECAVRQRLASLRQEVENEIKLYMKQGATTTKENEDSGVTSPGHHTTGASQDTLSLEQDSGSSASYQYSQVKEQKSTVVFPLTQDISTEDGQGSRSLSTSQEDTSTGHQKDSTMPPSTQGIGTKEREDSIVTPTPLDTPRTREAAGISILIKEENSVAPFSPPQDTTGLGAGESSRKSPVATQDRNGLTQAQKKFVKEFLDHCNKIYQEAETEKLEMLRNQKTVVHKILEDNKAKLHTVCLEYINRLSTLSALPDAVSCGQELACTLEESLSGEAVWVTEKYTELLQQYAKEQAARARSHSHITNSFTDRLTALFTHTGQESSKYEKSEKEEDKEEDQKGEVIRLEGEVRRLEAQLEARDSQDLESLDGEVARLREQVDHDLCIRSRISCDLSTQLEHIKIQVTQMEQAVGRIIGRPKLVSDTLVSPLFQRHLQGLYNDRDWYKRMVAVLSHVTLQLLHFYTVAQTLAQPAQDPHTPTVITPQPDQPVSRPLDLHSPTDIPSRLDIQVNRPLDMSFLSEDGGEGWVEGGHYTSFTDDEAATTGLVGAAGQDQDAHEQRGAEVAAAGSGRTGSGEGGSTCGSGLDSTGLSEGLLEDLDKDQQLRPLLTRSCPHLLAVLGGRWEKVNLSALEKEAQELAISLQAAAGMLNIFIHSTHSGSALDPSIESVNLSSNTLKEEKSVEGEEEANRMEEEACLKQRGEALNVNPNNKTDNLSAMTSKDDTYIVDLNQYDLSYLDLGDLSKTLIELVTEEHRRQDIIARENIDDYTQLHYKNSPIQEQLLEALSQLGSKEDLQLRLHHLMGRIRGLEEQQVVLEEENKKLAHTNKTLASKLQVTQDQLEEIESGGGRGPGEVTLHYAAKMEANKDLRERVRLLLSAKKKSNLCREELVERVSELEGIVGSVVSEADATIAIYKSQVTDLTQQLEAADRQVRSSRQFLEQQASERDQEMEELLATTSRITSQLKDKEAQLASNSTLQTEVESLERQLRDKNQELEEVRADRELTQTENKAAQDKIRDLREIIQTLEGQVDKRGMAEAELKERVVSLETALTHANTLAHSLSSQLEDLQYKRNEEQMYPMVRNSAGQGGVSEEEEEEERGGQEGTAGQLTSTSLFTELQEETDFTLLEMIEERLEKTIGGLEAVQLSSPLTPPSTAREAKEDSLTPDNTSDDESVGDLRCLSPPSLLRRMEGSLVRLGQVAEAAVKKVKQTETMHTNLKLEYDEAVSERDMAETRWREQVMAVAVLEAKVEELRHSQPITSTAQLNIRLTRIQEELENNQALLTKKAREVEEVKHALASTCEQLLARDKELERLQTQLSQHDSTGQPHSIPHTSTDELLTKHRQLENDLAAKNALIDKLKSEVREGMLGQVLPPSLAASLIAEKNAELDEQGHMLNDLRTKVAAVTQFLASGGIKEATQLLEEMRTGGSHSDRVDKGRKTEMTPEILRNIPPLSDVFLHTTYQREVGNVKEASIELSAVTLVSSEISEGDRGSSTTQPSYNDLQLMSPQPELHTQNSKGNLACSAEEEGDMSVSREEWQCECGARGEVAILRGHLKVLQKEVASLTDYQAKLEEDYQTTQGLLEAKEAELEEMTGEIEDRVEPPPPLLSLSSPVLCSCQALKKQNGELQDQLSELESSHQRREEETKETLWRLGEEKEQLMWEKQKLLREKQNLVEESNKLLEEKLALTLETETLKLTLRQFEEELENLKKNLRKLQEEEERLSTKVRERDQKVEEQTEKEEGLRKELQQRETQLRRREVELHELKTKERKISKEAVGSGVPCEVGDEQRLSSHSEQEVMRLHQHYQQEITGLKEQLIVREKELCSDYEERLAAQVSEMSRRLMDEHQAAKTRQQRVYEAALHAAQQDREHAMEQVWQLTQGNNQSQSLATDTSKLIASVDALTTRVREEVEHSGRLDDSLALLASQDKGQEGEVSTRASSIASDRSEVTDMAEVTSQLQHLIKKVHQQGIEMLTRVELLFLQKHSGQLDTTQRSLISHLSSDTTVLESETEAGEGTQMSRLEKELSKREQEEEKKSMRETMERRMEQEQLAGRAWRLAYEKELKEAMEQHEKDQLAIADLDVEIKELRADIFLNKLELQRAQDRITTLKESVEERVRQVNSLQAALDEEHINFTRVSKVLNQERKLATLGRSQQESVIKDLREKLTKECEKVLSLHKRLIEVNSEQETTKPAARQTPSLQELQIQLAAEQVERKKLEEAYDRERMRAAVALEKVHAECSRTRVELSKEKGQVTVLTKAVRTIKTEREVLLKQMSEKCKQVQQLERKLREAEGETQTQVCGVQLDQGESQHQEANRLSQGIHQLHLCTHNKPNEDDYCGVQLNLEVCKSVLELTDKLEEAQAERSSLQAKISSLESTVINLSSQLQKAATTKFEQHQEGTQGQDVATWAAERKSLLRMVTLKDSEVARLKAELRLMSQPPGSVMVNDEKLQYLYSQYLQCEHRMKALVWQKRYLLVVLRGYDNTERQTIARLHHMAAQVLPSSNSHRNIQPTSPLRTTFRVAVLGVMAVCRMRALVERFSRKKGLGVHMLLARPNTFNLTDRSWAGSSNSVLSAGAVGGIRVVGETRTVLSESRSGSSESLVGWTGTGHGGVETSNQNEDVGAAGRVVAGLATEISFTGRTPPTRGPTRPPAQVSPKHSRRTLFSEGSSPSANEYIKRLDSIHQTLGLHPKKP